MSWFNQQVRHAIKQARLTRQSNIWRRVELPDLLIKDALAEGNVAVMARLTGMPEDIDKFNRRNAQKVKQKLSRAVFKAVGVEAGRELYPLVEEQLFNKLFNVEYLTTP
jgi:hypothetical protein